MARRCSTARIKSHRSYEIDEAAETVGVTPQTVRVWIKQGLPALTEKRPYLILGWQLKAWLKAREAERKMQMHEGEFYCFTCHMRRNAAFGVVEIKATEDGRWMLKGFCEVCERVCNRFLSADEARRAG